MAAFLLIPDNLVDSKLEENSIEDFRKRGFINFNKFLTKDFNFYFFEGLGGRNPGKWENENGDFLCITGTLILDGKLITSPDQNLFESILSDKINDHKFSGAFCLIAYRQIDQKLFFIHDEKGMFRFYVNAELKIISSSFYVLAKNYYNKSFNKDIIRFNLLFGFTPSYYTWINGIERVLNKTQLPQLFNYKRIERRPKELQIHSFKKSVKIASELLLNKISIKNDDSGINWFLGLSSGYDSRLMASLLKFSGSRFSLFTFNKPGDLDPVIARKIAEFCQLPLIKKETERVKDPAQFQNVFSEAFYFFDAHAVNMMQYSKTDYTAGFRRDVFRGKSLHLSGVGGEIFRNYNFDHKLKCSTKSWINSYLLNGINLNSLVSTEHEKKLYEIFYEYLEKELGIGESINYRQRKMFYGELLLRDWHGVRNSIENQFSYYYTPFTDPEVLDLSYSLISHHGSGGFFEGSIINEINSDLANINSSYGYPLNSYPLKAQILNIARAAIKLPGIYSLKSPAAEGTGYLPSKFEEEFLSSLEDLSLGINIKNILKSSRRVEPLLATAYSINKIINA